MSNDLVALLRECREMFMHGFGTQQSLAVIDKIDAALTAAQQPKELHFIIDGPPSHESGRFVECEDENGRSINAGRWEQRGKYWHLIVTPPQPEAEHVRVPVAVVDRAILLLETHAEYGMQSKYADGSLTENSIVSRDTAAMLTAAKESK